MKNFQIQATNPNHLVAGELGTDRTNLIEYSLQSTLLIKSEQLRLVELKISELHSEKICSKIILSNQQVSNITFVQQ